VECLLLELRLAVPTGPKRFVCLGGRQAARCVFWRQAKLFGWVGVSVVEVALGGTHWAEKIRLPGGGSGGKPAEWSRFCFSPEGTLLGQPREERCEWNERRATLGYVDPPPPKPQRGGSNLLRTAPLGLLLAWERSPSTQGCANARGARIGCALG
jgi:hypothetical protein